ncbi:unnamed protein product [Amoebophrya sp. A25]|nr:unnamed protein product [Amoebophrya sp. A25]|eukprot:GSA25T00021345001.1
MTKMEDLTERLRAEMGTTYEGGSSSSSSSFYELKDGKEPGKCSRVDGWGIGVVDEDAESRKSTRWLHFVVQKLVKKSRSSTWKSRWIRSKHRTSRSSSRTLVEKRRSSYFSSDASPPPPGAIIPKTSNGHAAHFTRKTLSSRLGLPGLLLCSYLRLLLLLTTPVVLPAQADQLIRAPTDCWAGGWTPEICCSSPGAQGNPLCWDYIYTYEKCCTDTIEGQLFHHKRLLFIEDMVKKGAKVHFEIRQIEGTGRSGAVNTGFTSADSASVPGTGTELMVARDDTSADTKQDSAPTGSTQQKVVPRGQEVLRVPLNQTYGSVDLPETIRESMTDCDAHAKLAMGLVDEDLKGDKSKLFRWIELLPKNFANVLWYSSEQRILVNQTYFRYIMEDWDKQINCMWEAYPKIYKNIVRFATKWAFSIVKTRGFAFDTSRNSTLLIPLADFLNHHPKANVRTPDPLPKDTSAGASPAQEGAEEGEDRGSLDRTSEDAKDWISFKASEAIGSGEEMCIEYSQASNLEFMVRYGFKVDENPYGARHFDLGGEPLQSYCPPIILRHDLPEVVANATVDCHRQARYLAFEQQWASEGGAMTNDERLAQDKQIYTAVQHACLDLYKELETPKGQPKLVAYEKHSSDPITHGLVNEIRNERRLAQRCVDEFYQRKVRSDLVLPVNPDTVRIATKIAGAILNKYNDKEEELGKGVKDEGDVEL